MADTKLMSFLEHLGDLRKKIVVSLIALCIAFVLTFNYSDVILKFLMFPLKYTLEVSITDLYMYFVQKDKLPNTKLVFLSPVEGFWMNMKIAHIEVIYLK